MDSPTPPYLDMYRKKHKRSKTFVDGTYKGVSMKMQKQDREVERELGDGRIVVTMETICLIDWCDLAAPPIFGDAVVIGPKSFVVREYRLQGDGFARIELNNAPA